jgi:hypothetical protein
VSQPDSRYFITAGVPNQSGEIRNYLALSSLNGNFFGSPSFAGIVREYNQGNTRTAAFGYYTTEALGAWNFSTDATPLSTPEQGAGTIALLCLGTGGLAVYGKRRQNKHA